MNIVPIRSPLLDADPVLTGEHAADLDAKTQDVGTKLLRFLQFPRCIGVIEDQGMQVAVAGMEDIGDAKSVFGRQLTDAAQDLGQAATRDAAIHAVIVRSNAADGRKGVLAAGPKALALFLVLADLGGDDAGVAGNPFDDFDQVADLDLGPVQFDDQQGLDVEGIAGMDKLLGSVDRRFVHHLHAAGDDPGTDDRTDAIPRRLAGGEPEKQGACRLRLLKDTQGHFGNDPEQALGSGDQAQKIVPFAVQVLAAKTDFLAVHQHHL